jgi:hypothetical protein
MALRAPNRTLINPITDRSAGENLGPQSSPTNSNTRWLGQRELLAGAVLPRGPELDGLVAKIRAGAGRCRARPPRPRQPRLQQPPIAIDGGSGSI